MRHLYLPAFIHYKPPVHGLERLTFGIEDLDRLFEGIGVGMFVVFHGSWLCHILSEILCVRSQLLRTNEGLPSSVVFIDGGNIFDPYFISETARKLDLNPEEILRKIWVSRAFTGYQLTVMITEDLPKILDRENSRLVVISDVTSLYCDPDIGTWEAKKTFNHVTLFLWKLVMERGVTLVTTSLSSKVERKQSLEGYLLGRASIAAKVEASNPHVRITLEKHPFKPPTSIEFSFSEPSVQPLLEDFMDV